MSAVSGLFDANVGVTVRCAEAVFGVVEFERLVGTAMFSRRWYDVGYPRASWRSARGSFGTLGCASRDEAVVTSVAGRGSSKAGTKRTVAYRRRPCGGDSDRVAEAHGRLLDGSAARACNTSVGDVVSKPRIRPNACRPVDAERNRGYKSPGHPLRTLFRPFRTPSALISRLPSRAVFRLVSGTSATPFERLPHWSAGVGWIHGPCDASTRCNARCAWIKAPCGAGRPGGP